MDQQVARLRTGSRLGGYRVEGLLGEGGMGTVYRATQLTLGRPVALKVLQPSLAADAAAKERFKREGILAARLEHPRLVRVFEVGEDRGRLFLSYELIEGPTLREQLEQSKRLPAADAIELLDALAEGLGWLHSQGILHRDVKPANVFLDPLRGPLLGDLGIAKDVLGGGPGTQAGTIVGTPAYLAPEVLNDAPPSPAQDLYALGIVLYECLTGRCPFESEDAVETLRQHAVQPIPPVSKSRPDLGEPFDTFFARALAKEPSHRFDGAAAFREALQKLPRPAAASTSTQVIRRPAARAPVATRILSTPSPRAARRWPWLVAVAAAAAIALFSLPSKEPSRPEVPAARPKMPPPVAPAPSAPPEYLEALNAFDGADKAVTTIVDRYVSAPRTIRVTALPSELVDTFAPALKPTLQALQKDASAVAAGNEEAARRCATLGLRLYNAYSSGRDNVSRLAELYADTRNASGQRDMTPYADMLLPRYHKPGSVRIRALMEDLPRPLMEARHPLWLAGLSCIRALRFRALDHKQVAAAASQHFENVQTAMQWAAAQVPLRLSDFHIVRVAITTISWLGKHESHLRRLGKLSILFRDTDPGHFLLRIQCLIMANRTGMNKDLMLLSDPGLVEEQWKAWSAIHQELKTKWPIDFNQRTAPAKLTPAQTAAAPYHSCAWAMAVEAHVQVLDLERIRDARPPE